MPFPAFDPSAAVRFDLARGAADSGGAPVVLVPSAALEALERTAPAALVELGTQLGRSCGARIATRVGGADVVRQGSLEGVMTHLAGELALAGIGAIHIERWGRAMVVVVAGPSVANEAFIAAVLSGALGTVSGREVTASAIAKDGTTSRYFVGSKATAERVRGLLEQGKSFADALGAVQGGVA